MWTLKRVLSLPSTSRYKLGVALPDSMARLTRLEGACPVCDRHVARTVHVSAGIQKEVFHCPTHGALEYGHQHVPLAQLTALTASMPDWAQPLTGLEMVH